MMRSVLVLSFLLFSGQAWAGTTTETLHVFADFQAKPKNWVDTDGKPQGIFIEILKEVTERTGIQFTYSFGP